MSLPDSPAPAAVPEIAADAPTVLVVDDEPSNLTSIEKIFQKDGLRVKTAHSAREALDILRQHRIDVVLTDLMMPAISGLELLRAIKQISPDVEVVMMTAYGTVETAVQAMREGAYDFVEKPLKRMNIVKTARKAAERRSLTLENRQLKQEISVLTGREIIGTSPALRRVLDIALQAAPSSATVLVLGESGTGKELLARFIHQHSSRRAAPFVARRHSQRDPSQRRPLGSRQRADDGQLYPVSRPRSGGEGLGVGVAVGATQSGGQLAFICTLADTRARRCAASVLGAKPSQLRGAVGWLASD